jgi:hypothetical protein
MIAMKEALVAFVTVAMVCAVAPVHAEDNTSGTQPPQQTAPDAAAAKKKQKSLKDRVKAFDDKVQDNTVTADDQPSIPSGK